MDNTCIKDAAKSSVLLIGIGSVIVWGLLIDASLHTLAAAPVDVFFL